MSARRSSSARRSTPPTANTGSPANAGAPRPRLGRWRRLRLEEPGARLLAMRLADMDPRGGEGRDQDRRVVGVAQAQDEVRNGVERHNEIGERAQQGGADGQWRRR